MKYDYSDGSILLTGNSIVNSAANSAANSTTISTDGIIGNSSTSTCTTFTIQYDKKLEGVEFITNEEGNFIEITYSHTPTSFVSYSYPYPSSNNRAMSKERYGVVDGKMQLIKTIKGTETPGYYVEPDVEWEE